MTNETTENLTRAAAGFGTGAVHVVSPSRFPGAVVLGCSGRTLRGAVGTDAPVTCGNCRRRFAGNLTVLGEVVR